MENPLSPLDTLRQLKEMLDAGALTPTEFEALKQRLVFTPGSASASAAEPTAAPDNSTAAVAPVAFQWPIPEAPVAHVPAVPPASPVAFPSPSSFDSRPVSPPEAEVGAWVPERAPKPLFTPEVSANFPAAIPEHFETEALTDGDSADLPATPAGRNSSLGLILAIGGVLVFLALVAYLGFNRPTSEHISSTSQTAADSVATTIETGPQVAALPSTAAAPETVRVAPTNPAPVIKPRPASPVADSVAPATNSPVPDSAGRH